MPLTELVSAYLATLEDDGIPDPLGERLNLAAVLADLLTLAGEPLPPDVAAYLILPAAVEPLPAA